MRLDARVVPYLLPELGRFGYTPLPEIIVVVEGDAMLLADDGLEVMDLSCVRGGGAPEFLDGRGITVGLVYGRHSTVLIGIMRG